ncbi:MAG: SIMPL domain-containing protein [Chloroflexi bacterium]|nr:SIMPL domain-containing protein [Chloroflexota bacterium]
MRGIRVRGSGRAEQAPDMATLVLGVEVEAATAGEAQRLANERMRAVLAAITPLGIAASDVTTRRVSLDQTWDHRGDRPTPTGYQAGQHLAIRVRDLALVGPVVDAAVDAGANQVAEVTLGIADPSAARMVARDRAMADARATAEALARAGGVRIGSPLAIVETDTSPGPVPMPRARMAMAMEASMPVAAGEETIEVVVEVTWAIVGIAEP